MSKRQPRHTSWGMKGYGQTVGVSETNDLYIHQRFAEVKEIVVANHEVESLIEALLKTRRKVNENSK